MSNRVKLAQSSQNTLDIIREGGYLYNNGNSWHNLSETLALAKESSTFYRFDAFEPVFEKVDQLLKKLHYNTKFNVVNTTTLKGCRLLIDENRLSKEQTTSQLGCLNFASAKNPGGGFLGGSLAQEESLARSSALYPSLTKFEQEFYNLHKGMKGSYIYTDCMIVSPSVVVFKNEDDQSVLDDPFSLTFLTSPAVNTSAIVKNRPSDAAMAEEVMMKRIDKMLALFVSHGVEYLVLGAWGCGVFGNDPKNISKYFERYLLNQGKYSECFKSVLFAVKDSSRNLENISSFTNTFMK